MSSTASSSTSELPLFDQEEVDLLYELLTNPSRLTSPQSSLGDSQVDLKPTASLIPEYNLEWLTTRLFSTDHLHIILQDRLVVERFARFLETYQPQCAFQLFRGLKAQQVSVDSVRYSRGIAQQLEATSAKELAKASQELISDALPAFVTEELVRIATECLVKKITGTITPLMRETVVGLGEMFCITDTRMRDNPIVYASEEFLKATQYDLEYVMGRNCRFLQGPKTAPSAVSRIVDALRKGTEVCETVLNYRKDGSPFMNLLMVQPLLDDKGITRYHIGCQIDVSNLIEGGRGLDTFHRLLQQDKSDFKTSVREEKHDRNRLLDLARLLNTDEVHVLTKRLTRPQKPASLARAASIRVFPDRDENMLQEIWTLEPREPQRLPHVYQNYLLVRPAPSFRITFTSASLRIPGLSKSSFMDRIGEPVHVRQTIADSLTQGTAFTAKISWLTQVRSDQEGKPRWIHCTPMMGVDGKIGVWMIVMVEHETISGSINVHRKYDQQSRQNLTLSKPSKEDDSGQLYADYLRREVASNSMTALSTSSESLRKVEHQDAWWKDLGSKFFGIPETYKCIAAE